MQSELLSDIAILRNLPPEALYQEFHKIQFETLSPQWDLYFQSLIPVSQNESILKLYGPRHPSIPEWYDREIRNEISNSKGIDILFLNHVVSFLDDPTDVLILAKKIGFKTIVIHEAPKDGSFSYQARPNNRIFDNARELAFARHGQKTGNGPLHYVLSSLAKTGWTVGSESNLSFVYENDIQKRNLIKLELALDLIDHAFSGYASRFDEILEELMTWFREHESQVVVTGCSRWIVLT